MVIKRIVNYEYTLYTTDTLVISNVNINNWKEIKTNEKIHNTCTCFSYDS